MSKLKVTKAEYEILAAFRHALRQFLSFSEQAAHAVGVTPQHHQALLAIKGSADERLTVGELAERLQIRHHSAVGLANRLVSHGFSERKKSTTDRRQVHLALTAKGEAVLGKLSAAHKEQLRRVGPQIESLLKRLQG